jgi:phosphonate transport system ATP-binding protein
VGSIHFNQQDIVGLNRSALRLVRRQIGMVFQEYNLVERLTVMENLLTGRLGFVSAWQAWRRDYSQEDISQAFSLLEIVGLSGFENQRADSLSGGQRQRVGIARAVMQKPRLLLADEPTSSLDPKTSVEIMQLLVSISEKFQIPVVVNMHDVGLAKRFASRIIGMSAGRIVYDGDALGLSDPVLQTIYGGEDWMQ